MPDPTFPPAGLRMPILAYVLVGLALPIWTACGGGGGGSSGPGPGPGPGPLAIVTPELPPAGVGTPYDATLQASGGSGQYSWELLPGSTLPPGVTFSPSGSLSGTPTRTGAYPVEIGLNDVGVLGDAVSHSYTFTVGVDVADLTASPGTSRGSVILRFTAPAGEGAGPVDSYQVRASVRLLDSASDLASAAIVPQTYAPSTPGTQEVMTLTGIEPGQTLQFAVQAVRSGIVGPFHHAAASRVAEGNPPQLPAGAIAVSAPGVLSTDGAYYYLTQDITASGTAFEITGDDVTLDLAGHTITYGTGSTAGRHGVFNHNHGGTSFIKNGKIVQGNGSGADCHGVWNVAVDGVRCSHLDVTVHGVDAHAIGHMNLEGSGLNSIRVDHCTIRCDTTVVTDRHYPGVGAIWGDSCEGPVEIDHNEILSSPQWGIAVSGDVSTGPVLIHHNRVVGTKALVANGYMIGASKPDTEVFENHFYGESRGIHTGGPNIRVHDNYVHVQDQPNPEYPNFHWVHGIKVEGGDAPKIYRNWIVGVADASHAEVRCLDLSLIDNNSTVRNVNGIEVWQNRIQAIANDSTLKAYGVQFTVGALTSGIDTDLRLNVIQATDIGIDHPWDGGYGCLLRNNVIERDLAQGTGHEFFVERFWNGGGNARGYRLRDTLTTESMRDVDSGTGSNLFDSAREWTLTIVARDGTGSPVAGATVTVKDSNAATALSGTSNAQGQVSGPVVETIFQKTSTASIQGVFSDRTPHQVTVTKSGVGTYSGTHTVSQTTALLVDLTAGTAVSDTIAPGAPTDVAVYPISSGRLLVRWSPPTDLDVALYIVQNAAGETIGVATQTEFLVAGLTASTSYSVTVKAADRGGNVSAAAVSATATTRPDDRGP